MAGSINKVILIGRLGKDPEIRSTQDGSKIANLSLATSESWKTKSGERQEKTEWHKVVCFNDRTTDVIEKYCKKGGNVYVEGAIQTRKWTDKDGQDRYSTEIVIGRFNGSLTLLDSKGSGSDAPSERPATAARPAQSPSWDSQRPEPGGGNLDDEIPFSPCWQ